MATVTVDDQLYEKLAALARTSGRSVDQLVSETLARSLPAEPAPTKLAAPHPPEYYLPELNLGLKPGFCLEKFDELGDLDEDEAQSL